MKIRQTRGPGMNKGLKKPRKNKFPNSETESSSGQRRQYKKSSVRRNTYLSRTLVPEESR
jgi:hypothetical protein